MTLSVLGWIYFLSFLLGLGYTFISLFISHGHGGDGHVEVHGGVDHHLGGSHSTSGGDSGQPDFPLFSPLTLALSVTVFGGVGTLLNLIKMPTYVSFPGAALAGVAGWAAGFFFFFKFFRFAQSSSEAIVTQLIGKDAQVTLTIPVGGLGEINYVARGSQYNAPARSESGATLRAGTHVVIVKMDESVCTVKESIEERLNRLDDTKEEV